MCVCGISVGSTVYEIFLDLNKYFTTGGVSPWSGLRVPCDKYLQLLVSGGGPDNALMDGLFCTAR